MIKIILVDDHQLVRSSISSLIQKSTEMEVVAEASTASAVLKLLKSGISTDILLADMMMPEMDGLELLKQVNGLNLPVKVVFLSMVEDEKYASNAFNLGASGYLSKAIDSEELFFCFQHIMKGNRYVSSNLCISLLEKIGKSTTISSNISKHKVYFSEREIHLFELISEGKTNQEIADILFLSRRTVESNRQSLIDKSGVKNTAALIKYAVLNGLIS